MTHLSSLATVSLPTPGYPLMYMKGGILYVKYSKYSDFYIMFCVPVIYNSSCAS